MQTFAFAKTASKTILGTMTDFGHLLQAYLPHDDSLLAISLRLAKAPCKPIDMESPERATRKLFATPRT